MARPAPESRESAWIESQVAGGMDPTAARVMAGQMRARGAWPEDEEEVLAGALAPPPPARPEPPEEPGLVPRPIAPRAPVDPLEAARAVSQVRELAEAEARESGRSEEEARKAGLLAEGRARLVSPELATEEQILSAAIGPILTAPTVTLGRRVVPVVPSPTLGAVEAEQERVREAARARTAGEAPFTRGFELGGGPAGAIPEEWLPPAETPELDASLAALRDQRERVARRAEAGNPSPSDSAALRVLDRETARLERERWGRQHPRDSAILELTEAGLAKLLAAASKVDAASQRIAQAQPRAVVTRGGLRYQAPSAPPEERAARLREAEDILATTTQAEVDAERRVELARPAAAEEALSFLGLGVEKPVPLSEIPLVAHVVGRPTADQVTETARRAREVVGPVGESAVRAGVAVADVAESIVVPAWAADTARWLERKVPGVEKAQVAALPEEKARELRALLSAATAQSNFDAEAAAIEAAATSEEAWAHLGNLAARDLPARARVRVDADAVARYLAMHPEEAAEIPELRPLLAALAGGGDRADFLAALQAVPLRVLPESSVRWSLAEVQAAIRERRAASERMGGATGERIGAVLTQIQYEPGTYLRGKVESTAGFLMRVPAAFASELLLEADVPVAALGGPAGWMGLLLANSVADDPDAPPWVRGWGQTVRDLRMPVLPLGGVPVPSAAGIDHMLASPAPLLREIREVLGVRDYHAVRDFDTTWWSRVGANLETGVGGAFMHRANILHNAGVEEGSALDNATAWAAVLFDFIYPWERKSLGVPIAGAIRAGRGLDVVGAVREVGGAPTFRAWTMGAVPEAFPGTLKDADVATAMGVATREAASRQTARGDSALEAVSGGDREVVAETLRQLGFDFRAVADSYETATHAQRRRHLDALRELMRHGTPEDKALRASAPYRAMVAQLDAAVKDGRLTPAEALFYLGLREQRAWWEVDQGVVKTPEESFARSPVEVRIETGPAEGKPAEAARVPLVVTRRMREGLRAQGHPDAEIDRMTPTVAWAYLETPEVGPLFERRTVKVEVPREVPAARRTAAEAKLRDLREGIAARAGDGEPTARLRPGRPSPRFRRTPEGELRGGGRLGPEQRAMLEGAAAAADRIDADPEGWRREPQAGPLLRRIVAMIDNGDVAGASALMESVESGNLRRGLPDRVAPERTVYFWQAWEDLEQVVNAMHGETVRPRVGALPPPGGAGLRYVGRPLGWREIAAAADRFEVPGGRGVEFVLRNLGAEADPGLALARYVEQNQPFASDTLPGRALEALGVDLERDFRPATPGQAGVVEAVNATPWFHGTPHGTVTLLDYSLAYSGSGAGNMLGPGLYLAADPEVSIRYAGGMPGTRRQAPALKAVDVKVRKVLDIRGSAEDVERQLEGAGLSGVAREMLESGEASGVDAWRAISNRRQNEVRSAGFDGLLHHGATDGDVLVLFDPNANSIAGAVQSLVREGRVLPERELYARRENRAVGMYDPATGNTVLFRGGDLGTLLHEDGHLSEDLVRAVRPDLYELYAGVFGRDPATGTLTRDGQERAADAWRWYVRTRGAPNGRVRLLFDAIHLGLSDLWARTRGRASIIPPEIRAAWDAEYRPHELARTDAVRIGGREALARFPVVRIPEEGTAPHAVVERAGKAREAQRLGTRRAELLQDMGLRAGEEVGVADLVHRVLAYVKTEQARRLYGTGTLVRLTTRTIVPEARLPRVAGEALRLLVGALGTTPDKLEVKGDRVILSSGQGAGIRSLANELAKEPMGDIVPERLVLGRWPLTHLTLDELNRLQEAALDTRAGVGARRNRLAEAVPPTVGYRFWQAISGGAKHESVRAALSGAAIGAGIGAAMGGPVGAIAGAAVGGLTFGNLDWFRENFVVPRVGEGYLDPAVTDIVERGFREMGTSQRELMDAARKYHEGTPGAVLRDTLHSMRRVLVPEVEPPNVTTIRTVLSELYGEDVVPRAGALLAPGRLAAIEGALDELGGRSDDERAALVVLHAYADADVFSVEGRVMPEDERAALQDAIQVVEQGLRRRWSAIQQRGANILVCFAGTPDARVLERLTPEDYENAYNWFYTGDWDKILDWAESVGLETGRAVDRPPRFDREVAVMEALVRLRALEHLERMAERLTDYGLGTKIEELDIVGSEVRDRSAFADRVLHYINEMISWRANVLVQAEAGRPRGRVTRMPRAPETLGVPWPEKVEARAAGAGAMASRFPVSPVDSPGGPGNPHDMAAYSEARRLLDAWGFKSGAVWERFTWPDGSESLMPAMTADAIQEQLDEVSRVGGARGAPPIFGRARIETLSRVGEPPEPGEPLRTGAEAAPPGIERPLAVRAKTEIAAAVHELLTKGAGIGTGIRLGATVGMVVPTAAYFTGNFLGGVFQNYQKGGIKGMSEAFVGEPLLTLAVVRRLWGDGRRAQGTGLLMDLVGRLWTADRIADAADVEGLKSSFASAESARSMAEDIRDLHRPQWEKLMLAPVWWQRQLTELATAIDNFHRVGMFIAELKKGKSPAEAAASARAAGFDYAALTPFEKTVMRNLVLFYSYMRKNADLWWDTLLRNPDRILGQLRLMKDLNEWFLSGEPEIVKREDLDMRIIMGFRRAAVNTAEASGVTWAAPPLPVGDHLGLWVDLYDSVAGAKMDNPAVRGLVSRSAPWVQFPFVAATGSDIFYGRRLDDYADVPLWMVQMDYLLGGGLLGPVFGAGPVTEQDPAKWWTSGEPKAWRVRSDPDRMQALAWFALRNLVPGAGRGVDTLTTLDRANVGAVELVERRARLARFVYDREVREGKGGYKIIPTGDPVEPRYELTEADELAGYFGLKPVVQPTWNAQLDTFERRKLGETREEVRAAEKARQPGRGEGTEAPGSAP